MLKDLAVALRFTVSLGLHSSLLVHAGTGVLTRHLNHVTSLQSGFSRLQQPSRRPNSHHVRPRGTQTRGTLLSSLSLHRDDDGAAARLDVAFEMKDLLPGA